jgi:hypothetical protein
VTVDVLALALQGVVPDDGTITEQVVSAVANLIGMGIVAGSLSGTVALLYRWYVRERVPEGLAILVGLSAVAILMSTTTALGQVIGGSEDVLEAEAILANLGAFVVGGLGAYTGIRLGDRVGTDLFVATGGREIDADVSEIVRTVGRVTSVTLPEEIDDIVGYDPMPTETKEKLAGRRFLFPRRLTKNELRERLVSRLKTDYGVGHVDLELTGDGAVEYLAVGSRAAGIGPTLPPATNAVAIRADPANAASAGDLVQVWEPNPLRRVLTGELRGVAGEVVTVAIDAADTQKLDPTQQYKLVTLPVQDRPDREFASLLRAADETLGTATVEAGSDLDGVTVGGVQATIVAITREDTKPEPIPSRGRVLSAGDVLYAIATPETLRRLEAAAVGDDPTDVDAGGAPPAVTPAVERDPADEDVDGPPDAAQSAAQTGQSNSESSQPPEPSSEPGETTAVADEHSEDADESEGEMTDEVDDGEADEAESEETDEPADETDADSTGAADDGQSIVETLGGTPETPGEDEPDTASGADDDTATASDEGTAATDAPAEPASADADSPAEPDSADTDPSTADETTASDADGDEESESDEDVLDSFAGDQPILGASGDTGEETDSETDPAVDTADNIFESLNEGDDEDVDLDALLQGDDEDVAVWDPDEVAGEGDAADADDTGDEESESDGDDEDDTDRV